MSKLYLLYFYVPKSHLEQVKSALFELGAGKFNNYACCAWQTKGEGQFLPMEGSKPFVGQMHRIEKIPEYKVEMVVPEELVAIVVTTLKAAHPYEEPAYGLLELQKT